MKENMKPAVEVIVGLRPDVRSETSTNEYLASAQEKFPSSKLVALLGSLDTSDIDILDYALNSIGSNFSSFGIFEEDAEAAEVEGVTSLLTEFTQNTNYDEKRTLAKKIAALVD
ncbi:hypothetical protein A3C87_02215 [Candidatus Kaiserbacteria bacterium RIFCSPHIGHO2_02_FULL_49_34]|uniref:Uncharacterized protein n=1 Tax=Candidatus Kaiserbacteria bacterium RIFCSPHIGHO2_02_FULL_49_34 TaxID=1798491 RepID=A0A1F6DM38_9BACT|nr:MAG: hypothetical protein A3C87_02215 [Candidatus Kaiserbacteria bacterium RIFCSPHIGHO2_02_FULL_49_34]